MIIFFGLLVIRVRYTCKSTLYKLSTKPITISTMITSLIWKHTSPKHTKVFSESNTDELLQRKFQNWILLPSGCRMYLREEENLDHLFLHCDFAHRAQNHIMGLLEISLCLPRKLMICSQRSLMCGTLKGKMGAIGSCSFRALPWLLKKRNSRSVEDKSTNLTSFCNSVKIQFLGGLYIGDFFVIIVCRRLF